MLARIAPVALSCLAACAGSAPAQQPDAQPEPAPASEDRPGAALVSRLDDPEQRPAAVERIIERYQRTQAEGDAGQLETMLDAIVPPLVELSLSGELARETWGDVLALLADTRDPRALPALASALSAYEMDEAPPEPFDRKMAYVVRTVQSMAREGSIEHGTVLDDALIGLFARTHFTYPKAQQDHFHHFLALAMVAIGSPAWEAALIDALEQPIESTRPRSRGEVLDALYWQSTAARVLGAIGSAKASVPLLKVTLSPMKAPVHSVATTALLQIGEPALSEAGALLAGRREALAAHAEAEYLRDREDRGEMPSDPAEAEKVRGRAARAHLHQGARVVASIGTSEAADILLEAIDSGDPTTRRAAAAYLYLVPKTGPVLDAFRDVYDGTRVDARLPDGSYAKEAMLDAAASFFDLELVRHVLETSGQLDGDAADVRSVEVATLVVGAKCADAESWKHVEALMDVFPESEPEGERYLFRAPGSEETEALTDEQLVERLDDLAVSSRGMVKPANAEGASFEPMAEVPVFAPAVRKAQYARAVRQSKAVLDACGDDVDCYLDELAEAGTQGERPLMGTLKAAYMVGTLGGPAVKRRLLELLPSVRDPRVRGIIGRIFLAKSPRGDEVLAAALREMHTEALGAGDPDAIRRTRPFHRIAHRLDARAR